MFALGSVALLALAALAFDAGQMLLDRRAEQNAADAAALAGARFVVESQCMNAPHNCQDAVNEALRVALLNGYGDGSTNGTAVANGTKVTVVSPPSGHPTAPEFQQPGFVTVQISRTRPSIFAGVLGIFSQSIGAMATAGNRTGVAADYAMIALDKTACPSAKFAGTGTVVVDGNIQVDSSCTSNPQAFNATGNSTVQVTTEPTGAIDVVGGAKVSGGSTVKPSPSTGQPYVPDPLASLPAPPLPGLPNKIVELTTSGMTIPSGCPGGSGHATDKNPATCTFTSSYAGTTWLLSPGYYPGGISIQGGTILLAPGIYYIGGGGVNLNGTSANLFTVSATWNLATAPTSCTTDSFADCGGVLFYNTNDPYATSGGASVTQMQPISLNGSSSVARLYPLQNGGPYTNIIIFQDRNLPSSSPSGDIQLNGNGSQLYVQGTVYVPNGYVAAQGSGDLGPTQIIADTFSITGSGTLSVDYNSLAVAQLIAVGLVQ